MICKKIFI